MLLRELDQAHRVLPRCSRHLSASLSATRRLLALDDVALAQRLATGDRPRHATHRARARHRPVQARRSRRRACRGCCPLCRGGQALARVWQCARARLCPPRPGPLPRRARRHPGQQAGYARRASSSRRWPTSPRSRKRRPCSARSKPQLCSLSDRFSSSLRSWKPNDRPRRPVGASRLLRGQDLNLRPPGCETCVARSGSAKNGVVKLVEVTSDQMRSGEVDQGRESERFGSEEGSGGCWMLVGRWSDCLLVTRTPSTAVGVTTSAQRLSIGPRSSLRNRNSPARPDEPSRGRAGSSGGGGLRSVGRRRLPRHGQ